MENIGYIHAASAYEAPENIEVVPFQFDSNVFIELQRQKLSSLAIMRLLSVALTLFLLSIAGQALALEKYGSKGSEVTAIQKCLQKLGYFKSSVTGYYGSKTKAAVIDFQQDNQLIADGISGRNTNKTIQAKCSSQRVVSEQIEVIKVGSRSDTVKKLQQDLQQLNYFVSKPSGYFGPITKDAVIGFQKDNGLTVDGIPGSKTLAAIKQKLENTNNQGTGGQQFSLRLGSRGAEVVSLQRRLQQLKYLKGRITGYFGPVTQQAIINFQKDRGLTADGIVGARTQQAIDTSIARQKSAAKPQPKVNKNKSLKVGACVNGKCPTLRRGDRGRYVTYLQTRLQHWGYLKSSPSGRYDYKTAAAVKRLQQENKLIPDGAVGPQTWQTIEKPNNCNRPVLQRGDGGECVIKLQKRLQELKFFRGNTTGFFGEATWEGVREFQRRRELPPNGIVNVQTWKALEGNAPATDRYVVLVPITSPYTLEEVRRFVPDAFPGKNKLGKYVQAGEFQDPKRANDYSKKLRDRGFDARVVAKKML